MTRRRLITGGVWPRSRPLSTNEFLWRAASDESSFHTDLGPQLTTIGSVPSANVDLVGLSVLAFLADRTIPRPKKWEREIALDLPVHDPDGWQSVGQSVTETLQILTADSWTLALRRRAVSRLKDVAERPEIDRVLLFSGGADSLCGALKSLVAGERLLLVSHWDWAGHSAFQRDLASWLSRRFPNQVWHRQHHIGRRTTQLGGGSFGDEPTRRSRSLLFVALGLAYASIEPTLPLSIAENGYAALNPPLAGERRGALSTRTTHPIVLDRVTRWILDVGGHGSFSNPFASMTKGEMYTEVAQELGRDEAAKLLSKSHSCAHVRWAIGTGFPPGTQCGVCFGCLVRRAAFYAAGLDDHTTYLHTAIPPQAQPLGLRNAARHEVLTVRYAGNRGITAGDLLSVGLPAQASLDEALDVASRGLNELASIVDIAPDLARVT
jgi:hypothetical protein